MKSKSVEFIHTTSGHQGFMGNGHTAYPVIEGLDYQRTDPFIVMMDDQLDKQDGTPAGGPHPHAGFETVSLLLEGEMGDSRHMMKAGDMQIMTAGSGIVHTETIDTNKKMRLLQLWLNLPKQFRWTAPRVQDILSHTAPSLEYNGIKVKVYSGTFAGLTSPVKNFTPLILADISMESGTDATFEIPDDYTAFLYLLEGDLKIGTTQTPISKGQAAWLNRGTEKQTSTLSLLSSEGCRVVMYAAEPQFDPIAMKGPFIGDDQEDIQRLYSDYRMGKIGHISQINKEQTFTY